MPQFIEASDVRPVLDEALGQWHTDLLAVGVTFSLLKACRDDNDATDDHVLKLRGWPVSAMVSRTPYKQRVQNVPDVRIEVDAEVWKRLRHEERLALLDHELTHLELARDADGNVKEDKAGRPALRMRQHDYELGGFTIVANRHGEHAPEVQAARQLYAECGQLLFSFTADEDDAVAGQVGEFAEAV